MRTLLLAFLLSGCATTGFLGDKCNPDLSCEKGAICAYDNERLNWYCLDQDKVKPHE